MWGSVRLRYLAHFNIEILVTSGAVFQAFTQMFQVALFQSYPPRPQMWGQWSESRQNLKVWKGGALMVGRKRRWMSQLKAPAVPPPRSPPPPPPRVLLWLSNSGIHRVRTAFFLSPPILMLISFGNHLTLIPRNSFISCLDSPEPNAVDTETPS